MNQDPANSIASQWKGKLSENGISPWLLQDLGYLGSVMLLIYVCSLLLGIFGVQNKLSDFVTKIRVTLSEMFMIDFMGGVVRTISFVALQRADGILKITSVGAAFFFLLAFTYEFFFQLKTIPKLAHKDEKDLSKLEKALCEKYFEGLDEVSVRENKLVRFYNSLFLLKLILVQVLIYTLQYLQILQIFLPASILTASLILTSRSNC